MKLASKDGAIQHRDKGVGGRPEIPRNSLTHLLLESIPKENIKWENKVTSIQQASDGKKWLLNFAKITSSSESAEAERPETFDLVVGADGAWSKIRPFLTSATPQYAGVHCITLTIPNLTAKHPHFASMVGGGSYVACGDGKTIMAQRGSVDSVRMYLMLKSPSSTYLSDTSLDALSPSQLKQKLLTSSELYATWGESLKDLLCAACDAEAEGGEEISAKPLYMLPVGHTWTHRQGLTLIGDAAHLMTPFAGEGVNMAMLDALELSQGIIKAVADGAGYSLDAAVKQYEEGMFPRAAETTAEAERNKEMVFSKDSPKEFVQFFKDAFMQVAEMLQEAEEGENTRVLIRP
jgi:2-polyprenyl-6-methoxyphenol hydroxylase-like FAD-dependent oxidoreductase